MKKFWVEYYKEWKPSPISFWVYKPLDSIFMDATKFEPPLPPPVPGRGYAYYFVECDGFVFEFASALEINHVIEILSQKNLPRTIDLSAEHSDSKGPNSHWLSRLPAHVKAYKYRQKAVQYIEKIKSDLFEVAQK